VLSALFEKPFYLSGSPKLRLCCNTAAGASNGVGFSAIAEAAPFQFALQLTTLGRNRSGTSAAHTEA